MVDCPYYLFSTEIPVFYEAIGLAIGEAIAFNLLLNYNRKKAIYIAILTNLLSFFITQLIPLDSKIYEQKEEIIQKLEN
jgi:hypothetical protein